MIASDIPRTDSVNPSRSRISLLHLSLLISLVVYTLIKGLITASVKPLWFDELCTWIVIRQGTPSAIWDALAHGADGQPPGFYIMERWFSILMTNQHIALRLPSLLAACATLVAVFVAVSRRSGSWIALLVAALLLISPQFVDYSIEARPYAILLALAAAALLCYQRVPARRETVLLGICLLAASFAHYYALFTVSAFAIAEVVYAIKHQSIRWSVWVALTCACLPTMICWPLLNRLKSIYSSHFHSMGTIWSAIGFYNWAWGIKNPLSSETIPLLAIRLLTSLSPVLLGLILFRIGVRANSETAAPSSEYIAAVTLISLPFIVLAATRLTAGGFVERYALPALVGMYFGVGLLLQRIRRNAAIALCIICGLSLVLHETRYWRSFVQTGNRGPVPTRAMERLVGKAGHLELPVVVSSANDYLQAIYYDSKPQTDRLVWLADPDAAVRFAGTDSAEKNMVILSSYLSLHACDFQGFTAKHDSFLLYSGTSGTNFWDWWPNRLVSDGDTVTILASEGAKTVYLVKLNPRRLSDASRHS